MYKIFLLAAITCGTGALALWSEKFKATYIPGPRIVAIKEVIEGLFGCIAIIVLLGIMVWVIMGLMLNPNPEPFSIPVKIIHE
jgi:hypothetical protein